MPQRMPECVIEPGNLICSIISPDSTEYLLFEPFRDALVRIQEQNPLSGRLFQRVIALFGEAGRHARFAVGVAALPMNAPVEVAFTAEIIP